MKTSISQLNKIAQMQADTIDFMQRNFSASVAVLPSTSTYESLRTNDEDVLKRFLQSSIVDWKQRLDNGSINPEDLLLIISEALHVVIRKELYNKQPEVILHLL